MMKHLVVLLLQVEREHGALPQSSAKSLLGLSAPASVGIIKSVAKEAPLGGDSGEPSMEPAQRLTFEHLEERQHSVW